MTYTRIFTIFLFIAILSRIIPHPPNFTSMNAVAFLSTSYLGVYSFLVVFASMFLSDLFIGFHNQTLSVYLCFGITALLGYYVRKPRYIIVSSLIFFIVTNFSEWLIGSLYPRTMHGLELCYVAAIPFLQNQLFGDIFYTLAIIAAVNLCKRPEDTYAT